MLGTLTDLPAKAAKKSLPSADDRSYGGGSSSRRRGGLQLRISAPKMLLFCCRCVFCENDLDVIVRSRATQLLSELSCQTASPDGKPVLETASPRQAFVGKKPAQDKPSQDVGTTTTQDPQPVSRNGLGSARREGLRVQTKVRLQLVADKPLSLPVACYRVTSVGGGQDAQGSRDRP